LSVTRVSSFTDWSTPAFAIGIELISFTVIDTVDIGDVAPKLSVTLVTLNGAGSDSDGTIVSYLWTQTSGPSVTLSDLTSPTPTFTAPSVGSAGDTIVFSLVVTDEDLVSSTSIIISIIINNVTTPVELYCGLPIEAYDVVIDGTSGNDNLHGTDGNDLIRGYEGNDKINGKKGNDCIIGGPGNDVLNGQSGNDTIEGNDGDDKIQGNDGDDVISGGNGSDKIHGNNGNDMLLGDDGNDQIHGGNGNDTMNGGNNVDRCKGGGGGRPGGGGGRRY